MTGSRKPLLGAGFSWVLVTDDERMADPVPSLALLPAASLVILRAKSRSRLMGLARRTIPVAHRLGHRVLVAGPVRLALRLGADGAHFSETAVRRRAVSHMAPRLLPDGFIISTAAHGLGALLRAKSVGADFALLGPVFPTQSHPRSRTLGVIGFRRLTRQSPLPVVAIGGIDHAGALLLGANKKLLGFAALGLFARQ